MSKRNNKRTSNKINKSNHSSDSAGSRSTYGYPDTVDTAQHAKKNTRYDDIHSNDISWYNKSVTFKDAVRLPFNRIVGDPISVSSIVPTIKGSEVKHINYTHMAPTPGLMRIEYAPTIGISGDVNSQVNRCFTSIYADIYSKTTGAMQFQQADLALLSLGLSSIMANIAMVKRALGISMLFSNENYYYPKSILRAIGIEPESIVGQQDIVRMKLNEAISNVNHLRMPAFIDLFKRAYQLPLNIYADEDDIKSQLFAFVPEGYYVYHDIPSELSDYSCLEYKQFEFKETGRCMKIEDLLDIIFVQLESWRQSADLGIISGSIQRAYTDSQLIMLDWTDSNYLTIPVHDKVMNWQINNATLVGRIDPTHQHVLQDPVSNSLIHKPRLYKQYSNMTTTRNAFILNSYNGETDDEFIMESTRLIVHSPDGIGVDICGTEIPTFGFIYSLVRDGKDEALRDSGYQYTSTQVVTLSDLSNLTIADGTFMALSYVSRFRNAPRMETIVETADSKYYYTGTVGDLYRYTTVDTDGLRGLMIAAYQSIYVPMERTQIK